MYQQGRKELGERVRFLGLDGLVTRTGAGEQSLLPIWHDLTASSRSLLCCQLCSTAARSTGSAATYRWMKASKPAASSGSGSAVSRLLSAKTWVFRKSARLWSAARP